MSKFTDLTNEHWIHFRAKYFYTFGGAHDVMEFEDFVNDCDDDPDVYSDEVCACPICLQLPGWEPNDNKEALERMNESTI